MRRTVSVAELIRQDALDLDPDPPRPPCPIRPRLLILACSATKATGEGLVARERYQGPLWQTLRQADPDGSQASVCFLIAWQAVGRPDSAAAQASADGRSWPKADWQVRGNKLSEPSFCSMTNSTATGACNVPPRHEGDGACIGGPSSSVSPRPICL